MSTAANKYISLVALALGVPAASFGKPMVESLTNDFAALSVGVVEIDDKGRVIVTVAVDVETEGVTTTVFRPVATGSGDVRIFATLQAAQGLLQRIKLVAGSVIAIHRKDKASVIGDPIARLKQLFRGYRAEKMAGEKNALIVASKIQAATALGWNLSVGTPEAAEYADYVQRAESVAEAVAFCAARVAALGASLTAAGVDPLTL
jgi:hypothetical protein